MHFVDKSLSASEYWRTTEKARFASHHEAHTIHTQDFADAREAVELEMKAVKLMMSSIHTHYNTFSLINRLPPELLTLIFSFVRDCFLHRSRPVPHLQSHTDPLLAIEWVKVTHVCRQWRTVALENPDLWSHIILGSDWTAENFRRSQRVPLTIDHSFPSDVERERYGNGMYAYNEDMGNLRQEIAHHRSHLRQLTLSGNSIDFWRILGSLRGPAPLLERLDLRNTGYSEDDVPRFPECLNTFAPHLRFLRLAGWEASWVGLTFKTLVHLEVEALVVPDAMAGDLGDFLGALEKMPCLEVLKLYTVLQSPPSTVTPDSVLGPIVTLPRLRKFTLSDGTSKCGLALKHISTPVTTEHHITCRITNDYEFLLPWLSVKLNVSDVISQLSITDHGDCRYARISISVWAGGHSIIPGSASGEERKQLFCLTLAPYPSSLSLSQTKIICDALPLASVEELHMSYGMFDRDSTNWLAIFSGNKSVRRAKISFTRIVSFTRIAADLNTLLMAAQPWQEGQTQPIFPSLESLTLAHVRFEHDWSIGGPQLLQWLGMWGPLTKLVLEECSIKDAMLSELRTRVPEVVMKDRSV
ncbi:hypothetical protein EVG20_g8990 [Dentipellis fragilis]|uniref:F-box domain-containing protein n=1 Tax=Dentipellis fragilis TaxID=205917 RepID=A0A4Y9Y1E7_9AGAM|nr:hypothetical protein EVG20_g8990 [Dentipellis fragilis]